MNATANKPIRYFERKDFCDIIKTCSRSGVKKFKFKELEIEFFEPVKEENHYSISLNDQARSEEKENSSLAPQEETHAAGEEIFSEQKTELEKELLEEMRQAELCANDPQAYEQEMIDAELYKNTWEINDESESEQEQL
jgi:hypothetical protein